MNFLSWRRVGSSCSIKFMTDGILLRETQVRTEVLGVGTSIESSILLLLFNTFIDEGGEQALSQFHPNPSSAIALVLSKPVLEINCGHQIKSNCKFPSMIVVQWQAFSSLLSINERFKGDEEAENTTVPFAAVVVGSVSLLGRRADDLELGTRHGARQT
ncbi:hypothetical protein Sjap_023411 [Stephania japonica]|uniref:Uncharacterized protein n=1 Tax=Stephania japonica TaxID=461633 RepID=A0AAP0EK06_9MAGN